MIAENRQRVRSNRSRRYVKYAWKTFAGDSVHDGNHQQKPLRRRKTGRQGACFQRTVNRANRPGFRFHLYKGNCLTKEVFSPLGRPGVRLARHWGRRRNGINCRDFCKCVCNVSARFVAVHGCVFLFLHNILIPFVLNSPYYTLILRFYNQRGE